MHRQGYDLQLTQYDEGAGGPPSTRPEWTTVPPVRLGRAGNGRHGERCRWQHGTLCARYT